MAKRPKVKSNKTSRTNPKSNNAKYWWYSAFAFLVLGIYFIAFANNLSVKSEKYFLSLSQTISIEEFTTKLKQEQKIKSEVTLLMVAKILQIEEVRSGFYTLETNWGNLRMLAHLKSTRPRPFRKINLKNFRQRSKTVRNICKESKIDFKSFYQALNDSVFLRKLELNKENIFAIFLPLDVNVPKEVDAYEILEIIKSNFDQYWTEERLEGLKSAQLSPIQASILASIVYAETKNISEMSLIAGVYINRLKRGMRLESDPTLVFAKGDFSIQRIYQKHTQSSSNYNTYRKKGLPPGPIGIINLVALDAVTHFTEHDYIFFCAKEDLSGSHSYAETFDEHKKNAARYRTALNKLKIK